MSLTNNKYFKRILISFSLLASSTTFASYLEQMISVNNTPEGVLGRTTVLEVAYDTTDNNTQLSGLGMRVHFDSSLLSFKEITGLLEQDIIVDGQGPFSDDTDFDSDPLTDQYMLFGWASLYNNWPNTELPTVLMNIAFDVSENINTDEISSTSINFTDTSFTAGYEFSAESYELEIRNATWDFDGNGQADALTDGLMMLRHLFGLRGELVTNAAMASNSPLSSEQVVAEIEAAMDIADIDADGEPNALTDGLLLLRYLFGLRDDFLTNGVIGPDATRSSNTDIQSYLDLHMPNQPILLDLSLTVSVEEASSVRLTGPWWGWDPDGGPIAADNGDGTWTVTLDPIPVENMEYLWVIDGVQETLWDNAANAECGAEIDGGTMITDYANWGNRVWLVGSGDVTSTHDACAGSSGSTNSYCAVPVTHFNIEAETASAVLLTVERVDANNVDVSVTSADADPVDLLIIGGQANPAGLSPMTLANGTATITMTWANGAPDTASFEVLWSKESMGGNWMLRIDDLPEVNTATTCDPVSTALTAVLTAPGATSVGIVGPWWNGWDPTAGPVATDNGDGTWTVVFDPAPTDTMEYKWIVDGEQEDLITPAAAGECTAEIDAGAINTDYANWGNRYWTVGSGHIADTASACAGTSQISPALTATLIAPGVSSVRIVGPWWNGWDPTAGPVATDNGDGTWTVVFNPAPTDTMEYKWLVNGEYEDLVTPAASGECTAEIDAGAINTDYASWGNRYWTVGSGDIVNTASACAGTSHNQVNVTFQVNMDGVDTTSGVSLMAPALFGQDGLDMSDVDGDNIWTVTAQFERFTTVTYKYRNTTALTWDGIEPVAGFCTVGQWDERQVVIGVVDITLPVVAFGSCTYPITSVFAFEDSSVDYPSYGGVSASYATQDDAGVTRNMLKLVNGENSAWWSGVTLAALPAGNDFLGNGMTPITMRVYAEQNGDIRLDLEADGQGAVFSNQVVTQGWNNLSFDFSGVDASINWHKIQIRPDSLDEANNAAETIYYIDDVTFPGAGEPHAEITINESSDFYDNNNATWVKVIDLALVSDGGSSQAPQTLSMNVTELPVGGASYRVYKTTANGGNYFGNAAALTVGSNTITVGGVVFDRTVKIQVSSADIAYDSLAINGDWLYPGPLSRLIATLTAPGATSVGIVGPWWNGWDPTAGPVATDNADGTWTVTLDPIPDANMEYLWVVDGEQENLVTAAAAGECTAEIDAGAINTDYANWGNRYWAVGSGHIADTASACAGSVPPALTAVLTAPGATSVRLTGPWWSWDPAGGPVATDNGDGTWTVVFDPAPTDTMEYVWVVDGVQEVLFDNAANAECSAEIDGGTIITDYANWGYRAWLLDSGNVSNTYDACAGSSHSQVQAEYDAVQAMPAAPTPTEAADSVLSIFSNAYTNLEGTDFNPNWAQSTSVEVGDNLVYSNLNYQGTQFANQDVSGYEYLNVDYYVDYSLFESSEINFYLISPGAEKSFALDLSSAEQWNSVQIPLSHYDNVNLADVFQFKVVGNGSVAFNNIYFGGS